MAKVEVRSGDIVHYRLSEQDCRIIGERVFIRPEIGGGLYFPINKPEQGQHYPMIVVVAHSAESVNGQVFLDGAMTHWTTSVVKGESEGQWLPVVSRKEDVL